MSGQEKCVSAVIVNWNTCDILLKCLESLFCHSGRQLLEIIVVDNGSSDDSVCMVRLHYPQVQIIPLDRNVGFASANNVGIRRAGGEYICLVNSDVELICDAVGDLVRYMERVGSIGLAAPRLLNPDLTVQQGCWRFPTLARAFCTAVGLNSIFVSRGLVSRTIDLTGICQPAPVDVACGAFLLVRRQALQEVGPLDETFFFYGEDIDWCKRFWNAGWQVMYVPNTKVVHFGGQSSTGSTTKFDVQLVRTRFQYWRKYYPRTLWPALWCAQVIHHLVRIIGFFLRGVASQRKRPIAAEKVRKNMACLCWLMGVGGK